ncbi:hypothetical protein [Janthinobacterium agaricidamnosum]|uniref:Uncharacterized domain protein n=1 Tax=Janthinobacterium agaricidamnosum NBRC 102515 = DSM 9628 TaxID=1349767 RepID=W0V6B4_9BURK|nr:hypothetical protein [Janthinobacterium agaricidamnosum]CDG83140.1 putative uncharacterized domain protein [Janthinobacterium agaricidamnosum NBRC 102515 = DSM 9628]
MKNLAIALLGASTIGITVPALAGPDWQVIDHARVAKAEHLQQQAHEQPQAVSTACREASKKLVLPLDHGPHAQATPWLNQQRLRQAEEARAKACAATPQPDNRQHA